MLAQTTLGPRTEGIGATAPRIIALAALVAFAAVAPLLAPIAWKANATFSAAALLIVGVLARGGTQESLGRSALDAPALVFLGAAILATAVSVEPLLSLFPSRFRGEGLLVYMPHVALALAAARLTSRETKTVITAMLAAGTLVGLIALPQYYGVDSLQAIGFRSAPPLVFFGQTPVEMRLDSAWIGYRGQGTLNNPLFLGGYIVLLLPLAVAQAVTAKGRASWAYGAVSIVLYAALVSSQTRSAWVASALAGVVLLGLLPKSRVLWRRGAALAVAFVIVTVVLIVSHAGAALPVRGASTFDTRDYSMRQKLYVWKHTLPLIAERPVTGWGFSTLVGQFKDMGSPEYLRVFGRDQIVLIDTPHNELLHVAYSTGLLGLIAFLWIWTATGRALLAALRAGDPASGIAAALTASLAGYFIWMQFAWSMIGPANVFWVVVGLAASVNGPARAPRARRGAP